MEYVDGPPLNDLLASRRLTVAEAVEYARQVASALAAAHAAGIVHRDIKPANILIGSNGLAKVADFGLAKLTPRACISDMDPTLTAGRSELTEKGVILGTIAYMSPEQAQGMPIDERSDVFSLGVVLYEMLAGRRPFAGDSNLSTLMAIVRDAPSPPVEHVPEVPAEIARVVHKALEKGREDRSSAAEVLRELAAWQQTISSGARIPMRQWVRRPRVGIAAAVALLVVAALVGWTVQRRERALWARTEGLPAVNRLAAQGKFNAAFSLLQEVEKVLGQDAEVRRLWPAVSRVVAVETEPPGVDVQVKDYRFRLPPKQQIPSDMALVPDGIDIGVNLGEIGGVGLSGLGPFLMDRYEVTNRHFKEFIVNGGYQKREWWKQPFRRGERELSWNEAMAEFRDATGRPGPSTWEAGTYPEGKDEFPVGGVSWHEAAAYCEYAGKQLPTIYHWYRAADVRSPLVTPSSNFSSAGPARVGFSRVTGPFGTFDMAGNIREWCFNDTGDGERYVLGGSWRDPEYQFQHPHALQPFDRSDVNGFRCVRYLGPVAKSLTAARKRLPTVNLLERKPVSEDVFRAYRSLYSYDRSDLKAAVEATDATPPDWTKLKVSFQAAYGNERVPAYLFLPKGTSPPYQTVVYYPGAAAFPSGAWQRRSSAELTTMPALDFAIRSGRAALYPVYYSSYERSIPAPETPVQRRERDIRIAQDLMRSVDYLETRPDIARGKIGYIGLSSGANRGPVLLALEDRIRVAVLLSGGIGAGGLDIPETHPVSFAPWVHIPVLMISGRQDFTFPVETSQKPLFQLLGTREADKRHVLFDGGHDVISVQRAQVVREALNWLDQYLGPVKQ
jgi:dienelactone hydrolase